MVKNLKEERKIHLNTLKNKNKPICPGCGETVKYALYDDIYFSYDCEKCKEEKGITFLEKINNLEND